MIQRLQHLPFKSPFDAKGLLLPLGLLLLLGLIIGVVVVKSGSNSLWRLSVSSSILYWISDLKLKKKEIHQKIQNSLNDNIPSIYAGYNGTSTVSPFKGNHFSIVLTIFNVYNQRVRTQRALLQYQNFDFLFYLGWFFLQFLVQPSSLHKCSQLRQMIQG